MDIKVLNLEGNKSQNLKISDDLTGLKVNNRLLKYVIDWQINHAKTRLAKTKQRNEIVGSTRKIYAQKGTGGARHASRKAPIFVGGGVAHGPKGESSYKKKKMNKNEKKLGIASLITEKNNLKNLLIFSDFKKKIEKTKEMSLLLKKFNSTNALIILDKLSKENIYRSIKNIPNIKVTDINHFNAFDIVKFEKIIFTESSVKELEKRYA